LRNFMYRRDRGLEDDEYGELQNGIHERVIAQRGGPKNKEFLVKWCGQSYSETTWEPEAQLSNDQVHTPEFVNEAWRGHGIADHCAVLLFTCHTLHMPLTVTVLSCVWQDVTSLLYPGTGKLTSVTGMSMR
jgi:hypothetical protein